MHSSLLSNGSNLPLYSLPFSVCPTVQYDLTPAVSVHVRAHFQSIRHAGQDWNGHDATAARIVRALWSVRLECFLRRALAPAAVRRASPETSMGAMRAPVRSRRCLSARSVATRWSTLSCRICAPVSSTALESPRFAIVSSQPHCTRIGFLKVLLPIVQYMPLKQLTRPGNHCCARPTHISGQHVDVYEGVASGLQPNPSATVQPVSRCSGWDLRARRFRTRQVQ